MRSVSADTLELIAQHQRYELDRAAACRGLLAKAKSPEDQIRLLTKAIQFEYAAAAFDNVIQELTNGS